MHPSLCSLSPVAWQRTGATGQVPPRSRSVGQHGGRDAASPHLRGVRLVRQRSKLLHPLARHDRPTRIIRRDISPRVGSPAARFKRAKSLPLVHQPLPHVLPPQLCSLRVRWPHAAAQRDGHMSNRRLTRCNRCGAIAPAAFCARCGLPQEYSGWEQTPWPMLAELHVCERCGLRIGSSSRPECPRCQRPLPTAVRDPNPLVRLAESLITASAYVFRHMRGK